MNLPGRRPTILIHSLKPPQRSPRAQDNGGPRPLRIAPAWPKDWSGDGSVSIAHGARVYVQVFNGQVVTVGVRAGAAQDLRIRNPWKGRSVQVIDAASKAVVRQSSDPVFTFPMKAGKVYLLEASGSEAASLPFAPGPSPAWRFAGKLEALRFFALVVTFPRAPPNDRV